MSDANTSAFDATGRATAPMFDIGRYAAVGDSLWVKLLYPTADRSSALDWATTGDQQPESSHTRGEVR